MPWIRSIVVFLLLSSAFSGLNGQFAKPPNNPLSDYIPFHFGFSVGYTYGNFAIVSNNPEVTAKVVSPVFGFEIQGLANKRISKNLTFRVLPGLGFVTRFVEIDNKLSRELQSLEFQSIFLGMPILLKYKSDRVVNFAPYIIGGVNPRWELSGGIKKEGGYFFTKKNWYPALSSFNPYVELGTGIDFYFPTARMGVEFKYSVGLLNNKLRNVNIGLNNTVLGPYSEYIDELKPSIFIISIIVEQ
jgi:hypothetical protein